MGIVTFGYLRRGRGKEMRSSVERFKRRRMQRLLERASRADEDDGRWVTSEEGHKIHLNENGVVDKANPFVLATMGKPKDVKMPKKSVKLRENKPFNLTASNREDLGKALVSRKDKNVVFGGFYKVEQSGGTFQTATFFNPYTGDYFTQTVSTDDDRSYYDDFYSELRGMEINDEAKWLWKRSNGVVQTGDKVKVTKGRTLAHGTTAKVTAIRPFKNKYGKAVADYAYLDNGEKININNVSIVED